MSAPATLKQTKQVIDLFGKAPTAELVQQFIAAGDLVKAMLAVGDLSHVDRSAFQALIAKATTEAPEPSVSQAYPLFIDFSSSLEQMVAAGSYDYVNPDITEEHFPLEGKSDVEVKLVHFDRFIQSDDVLSELDRLGYRPATMAELATFGATNPELQRQFPIVALGSVWTYSRSDRDVGSLGRGHSGDRRLSLLWFGFEWDPTYRFLAVCK